MRPPGFVHGAKASCPLQAWSCTSLFPLGIVSDDHVLAAALWRNLFNKNCDDPRQLELLVEYVRKQMQYLDAMNGDDLLLSGEVTWRPLVEYNAQSLLKLTSPVYNDEGL
uniref:Ubiquinol-cytochrome c chaperone domain-containing protein n=1 Tax=Crocodylus porosus TaxID=8502 RepID=A0A7M4F5P5_CROPO